NDSYTDCADLSCRLTADICVETGAAECSDNADNDGDGHIDCEDFDCQYDPNVSCPNHETSDATCSDNEDNDNNSYTDCEDFSCQQSPQVTVCEGNEITCADGLDNDGNGYLDCDDNACRYCGGSNPHVVDTCPPCD
ncbi:MAG: hypothetical protein DRI90_28545, partial [Deltaproteobacteria bacterium]